MGIRTAFLDVLDAGRGVVRAAWDRFGWRLVRWYNRRQRARRPSSPPHQLQVGLRYEVRMRPEGRDDLPLMPALTYAQAVQRGDPIRRLEVGSEFKVLAEVDREDMMVPWYKVLVTAGANAGTEGLLNGTSLYPRGRVEESHDE